jgi:penicillin-binding protein 2
MARLEARRIDLPGFIVTPNPVRTYPYGDLMGPVLGYMGSMTMDELTDPLFEGYDPSDYIGRAGIEKAWENRLRGTPGGVQVEVDVVGRKFGELNRWPATPGHNLVLTIDRAVQQAAEAALGEDAGSVVAIEPGTGKILAMVSRPGYDPNMMARGVTSKEWSALVNDPKHPLQNRPVQGTYAPGSTFKIVMALAGLDKGVITPASGVSCGGGYQFGGRRFRCWKSSGHGGVSLESAIAQSCDVYFYKLGNDLGVDAINEYSRRFGLGSPTGVDLPGERSGLIPSTEWKRKGKKEPWYAGETLSVAIGQGSVLATPIQLANMVASVADPQGRVMRPMLVDRIESPDGKSIETVVPMEMGKLGFQLSHLAEVRHGLRQVVAAGTARSANLTQWKVAGKTGTAQVMGQAAADASSELKAWEKRDNALFVCYAPYDEPKIAVAVIVDHGGHGGSAAAPVAAKVVKAYHDVLYPPPPELNPMSDETSDKFVGPPEWSEDMAAEEGD